MPGHVVFLGGLWIYMGCNRGLGVVEVVGGGGGGRPGCEGVAA